jgi:hypothetical protein
MMGLESVNNEGHLHQRRESGAGLASRSRAGSLGGHVPFVKPDVMKEQAGIVNMVMDVELERLLGYPAVGAAP